MVLDIFRVTPKSRVIKLKKKRGVLFSNPGWWGKVMFYGGTILFTGLMIYGGYLYWPLGTAVVNYLSYQEISKTGSNLPLAIPTVTETNSNEYSITVPKILAYAKIIEKVSPYDKKEYLKVLEQNVVAQATNTSEVGGGVSKSTYLFAHSSQGGVNMVRNNSVFYLLGELNNSDVIYVNRYGKIYTYQVYKQKVIGANQVEFLNYTEPDKEILILQTCWPIGTDWKRLLVFAARIK